MPSNNGDILLALSNYPNAYSFVQNMQKNNAMNNQFQFRIEVIEHAEPTLTMYVGPLDTNVRTITAFADGGSGTVDVTSVAHGFADGDIVTITGTTNYNGTFTITLIDDDSFTITDTWVANDATGSVVYADTIYTLPMA